MVAEFCKDDRLCVDDTLEIVFESGSSTYAGPVEAGVEVPIEVVIDTKSPDIQGYSWAVKHDADVLELIAESVTAAGTVVDPGSPDTALGGEHFGVQRAVDGGFIAAMILSLRERVTLPLGRNVVCRARYEIMEDHECTVIRFVHLQLVAASGFPPVGINITTNTDGRAWSKIPRWFRHGLIRTGDCRETCDDLADNDGDGLGDCTDPECLENPACSRKEHCFDGVDNNGDGLFDSVDPDCVQLARSREDCNDLADNDADSLIDCDDSDCWRLPNCISQEICDDGIDNDRDSRTDCKDRDCGGVGACPEFEVCGDGHDNDEDGFTDCDDPECLWQEPCVEVCGDGIDNDGDGFLDGLDLDCNGYGPSPPDAAPPLAGVTPPVHLIRGDADGSGRLTVLDAVVLIQAAVNAHAPPFDCFAALNTNDDGGVGVADALPILRWIFLNGPPLPGPFPECGSVFGGCNEPSPGCR